MGRDSEYWLDPDLHYCSCSNFYFKGMSKEKKCYHLNFLYRNINSKNFETISFNDEEFSSFTQAIIKDMHMVIDYNNDNHDTTEFKLIREQ